MARPIVLIPHLYRLADVINFRKDYSPPSSPPSRPFIEAKSVSAGLAVDLTEARRNLQAKSDELGILSAALRVACDDLEVVWSKGTSSLAAHVVEITA